MNTQETANRQEEAQKIWDQLEAEDKGIAPTEDTDFPPDEHAAPANPTDAAPADTADAHGGSDEVAPTGESVLLDKIAGLETMLGQVTQRLRNAEGHIGGLGSQMKQQLQAAQQVSAKGGEAPTAGEIREAQSNPRAMESLKRDYPEFAEAMEAALNEQLQAIKASMPQPQMQQAGVTAEEFARMRSEMAVEIRHPGWQDRVKTTEFMGWMQHQPREVQMLAASEGPQDAVRLLDLHSEAMKSVSSQRTQRLSSAAAIPSGRSGGSVRQKAVEDMSPEEYWRYLDELDRKKG
jgi:hypothetical protein